MIFSMEYDDADYRSIEQFNDFCKKYGSVYIPTGGPGIPDLTSGEMTKTLERIAGTTEDDPEFRDKLRKELDDALEQLKK